MENFENWLIFGEVTYKSIVSSFLWTQSVVPESSDVSTEHEILQIREWAVKNKMTLNMFKNKEIVFHRPRPSK